MIPKRIVLDTNVCLDLFVFHDTRWTVLLTALKDGQVEAITREDCRHEWLCVLNYPHLQLDNASKIQSTAEFDSLITCRPRIMSLCSSPSLPICSDPDDQKFLELARDVQADILITKDKALLKLAKKTAKAGLFSIMSPDTWISSVSYSLVQDEKIH